MKRIVTILIIISVLFSLTSCEHISENIKEESVEKIVGKILGEEVDVDIISPTPSESETTPEPSASGGILDGIIENDEDGEIDWPEDIPSDVPKADFVIKSKMKTPNGVILDFGEVEASAVIDYTDTLKNNHFEAEMEEISEKRIEASYNKSDISVKVYWYKDGDFSIMITW
jgi:hypothetical protein